jgi:hypothetical protein
VTEADAIATQTAMLDLRLTALIVQGERLNDGLLHLGQLLNVMANVLADGLSPARPVFWLIVAYPLFLIFRALLMRYGVWPRFR